MTNKELILNIYPFAKISKTTFGYMSRRGQRKTYYYIRNGDSLISNWLYDTPQEAWRSAAKIIKKNLLEKLEQ